VRMEPCLFCPEEISCGFGFFSLISFFLSRWLAVCPISCDDQTNTFVLPNATERSNAEKSLET